MNSANHAASSVSTLAALTRFGVRTNTPRTASITLT